MSLSLLLLPANSHSCVFACGALFLGGFAFVLDGNLNTPKKERICFFPPIILFFFLLRKMHRYIPAPRCFSFSYPILGSLVQSRQHRGPKEKKNLKVKLGDRLLFHFS
jgi:hypothetical protein